MARSEANTLIDWLNVNDLTQRMCLSVQGWICGKDFKKRHHIWHTTTVALANE